MQLSDSAFPSGGFAHSGGFEAALQAGEVQSTTSFESFLKEALWQSAYGILPLANEAFENTLSLETLDELCDAFLSSSVANKASRVQGRSFLSTCVRSFANEELIVLNSHVEAKQIHQHYAPIFGSIVKILGLERNEMQQIFLFSNLRSILSASIRLGVIGPYQAQRIQFGFSRFLNEVHKVCKERRVEDIVQTAPLLEIFQSLHDRLYSKLFQS
jgi:urease accessory protein